MAEHTKTTALGNWFCDVTDEVVAVLPGGAVVVIAKVNPLAELDAETTAKHSRLIAAAPELLSALVNLDTLLDFGDDSIVPGGPMEWPDDPSLMIQRFREAQAAIAKALGADNAR